MLMFFLNFVRRIYSKFHSLRAKCQLCQFAEHGMYVHIGHHCDFIPQHIHVGSYVSIGDHASFIASIAHIYIGNYVLFGPHVTIRGGDHRVDFIGKHIYELGEKDKKPENDKDVVIEDGVWVGCNVTILKGVAIGKGAVIGAGSVVTKSIPAYAIAVGNPAKVIRFRFNEKEIKEHEDTLKSRGLL